MIGVGVVNNTKKAQKHTTVLVLRVEFVYEFCGTPIGKKLIPSPYACRELLAVPS